MPRPSPRFRALATTLRLALTAFFLAASLSCAAEPATLYRLDRAGVRRAEDADLRRMTRARLLRISDGDTIVVEIAQPVGGLQPRERVRLIGIDAPEVGAAAEEGALEATAGLAELLAGGELLLAYDRELRDKYGRLLAHVFLPDGRSAALEMIRRGFARPLLSFPFALSGQYRAAAPLRL